MSAVPCHKCGRPNNIDARRCIWCGAPMSEVLGEGHIHATSVEIGYVEGIDRFDDAGPVRLIVSAGGIEVFELMPGSRSIRIPADCVLETRVRHSRASHNGRTESKSWKRLLKVASTGETSEPVKRHSVLTIKYRINDGHRQAVFYRDDPNARVALESLAKALAKLVRARRRGPEDVPDQPFDL